MRYLVTILIAANLAFYFLYPRSAVVELPRVPLQVSGAEPLLLISERPVVLEAEVDPVQPMDPMDTEDAVAVLAEVVADSNKAGTESATQDEREVPLEIPDDGDEYTVEAVLDEITGDAEASATQDQNEAEVNPETPSDIAAAVPVEDVAAEIIPEPVCFSIGPFLEEPQAAALVAPLEDSGYLVSERSDSIRQPAGYWVYLSAMPKAEARRIVSDLKAHGIKDYFVGKQHYISLGIFSRKSQALRRQKQISGLGYAAVLERRFRDRPVHWLDVRDDENSLIDSELGAGVREQYPELEFQQADCE